MITHRTISLRVRYFVQNQTTQPKLTLVAVKSIRPKTSPMRAMIWFRTNGCSSALRLRRILQELRGRPAVYLKLRRLASLPRARCECGYKIVSIRNIKIIIYILIVVRSRTVQRDWSPWDTTTHQSVGLYTAFECARGHINCALLCVCTYMFCAYVDWLGSAVETPHIIKVSAT